MDVTFGACDFRIWDQFGFVVVKHESVDALDKAEMFATLEDEGYWIFEVNNMRGVPVWNIVDVALRSCSRHEVAMADR